MRTRCADTFPRVESTGSEVTEGYLLMADISGYTEFLTGTELEHSHAIVTELTNLIRSCLAPPMRYVKRDGDSVFCFSPEAAFPNGELLLELAESCYFDFETRLQNMTRSTTCPCDACRQISDLDLKFVAHFGSFLVDRDLDGRLDLAGPDVILIHRFLKNRIIEQGGPCSYAFLTEPCATRGNAALRLPVHTEVHEPFGAVTGVVQDLAAVAAVRREAQRVRLTHDDADFVSVYEVDAPPSVCWQYLVEPGKRLRHVAGVETTVDFEPNADGRIATGAVSHCAHGTGGEGMREYLDWRPYEYFTCRLSPVETDGVLPDGIVDCIETYHFEALENGRTRVWWLLRGIDRSDEGMAAFDAAAAVLRLMAADPSWGDQMRNPIAEDASSYGLATASWPRAQRYARDRCRPTPSSISTA